MGKNTMMGWINFALALGVVVVLVNPKHADAVTCEEAASIVMPCKPFLVNDDRKPSTACCTGLQSLEMKVVSKPELKELCECLKNVGSQNAFKPDRALRLPQFCGASVPIDYALDCNNLA